MELVLVGAGVGRTGTHSLKIALEKLLDGLGVGQCGLDVRRQRIHAPGEIAR
jgi:hypothetical protein